MKKLFVITFMVVFSLAAVTAYAQTPIPGDVGTYQCRQVQIAAQQAVLDGKYKNHGQMVSTAAKVVDNAAWVQEIITCECASCIMHQFAQSIPIAEQEPCGPDSPNPECEAAACGTYIPCDNLGSCPPTANTGCIKTAEGLGVCIQDTPCAGLFDCTTSADCPDRGAVCAVSTCCGRNVCIPASQLCPQDLQGAAPAIQSFEGITGPTTFSPQ
jgi:hypothetical protein